MQPSKRLWYVALADLSDSSSAATIHARADVLELAKLGWEVLLHTPPSHRDAPSTGRGNTTSTPRRRLLSRVCFELALMREALRERRSISFALFRGPSTMVGLALLLTLLDVPFGVELNGVLGYRIGDANKLNWLMKLTDRFFMKHATIVVAVTEQLSQLVSTEVSRKASIVVAPNGADVDCHHPVLPGRRVDPDMLQLGFVGTFYRFRGLPVMIDTIAALVTAGVPAQFNLVGDGPLLEQLQARIRTLGIDEHIRFTGRVPASEVGAQVAHCDLMLAFFEPEPRILMTGLSPLKFGTYLALAKPVLLWDQGLIAGADEIPGVFRVDGNPTATELAEHILTIWQQHGRDGLRELGLQARQYAVEHMTWEVHAQIIDRAIREVLATTETGRQR